MSGTANNSFAERTHHLRARTLAAYHLTNSSSITGEFFGVQGIDSERTVRRTGQIDYVTQGSTNPNSVQQGCACSSNIVVCSDVGTFDVGGFNLDTPVDNLDGTYTISFSWIAVTNATTYTFESDTVGDVFNITGPTSATVISTDEFTIFRVIASNSCSSVTSENLFYCFLAGSLVRMADGTDKVIEDISVGDLILGAFGEINPVIALHRSKLGTQQMININDEHKATANHPHIGPLKAGNLLNAGPDYGFYVSDISGLMGKTYGRMHTVIDADGNKVQMMLHGLNPGRAKQLAVGTVLQKVDGPRTVDTLEHETMDPDTDLYNLVVGGSHTYYVDGYAVTGWPREDDFDYDNWVVRT